MESPILVLTIGVTAFMLLLVHEARAGNEDLSLLVKNQNEKIYQLTEYVMRLQEKTTTLEERQEEDTKKFNDIIAKQQTEINVLKEKVLICQDLGTNTELEIRENIREVVFKLEEQNNKMNDLQKDVITTEKATVENTATINILRNPPESFTCGYKSIWPATLANITYDSMFYERSNQPSGGLDIGTGVFTAPYPGTYTVSWSLSSTNDPGNLAYLYLYKNGHYLPESMHYSSLNSFVDNGHSHRGEQGGRTMIMHLDLGETVTLWYDSGDAHVMDIMFCVQLTQFDYGE